MRTTLLPEDLNYIVNGLPKELRSMMQQFRNVVLAGGAIRASVAGEEISDYDFWVKDHSTA